MSSGVGITLTEGTPNFLVNCRKNKSQQIRWSRRGADRLLQVRCTVYNGALGTGFGQCFYAANDLLLQVTAAACPPHLAAVPCLGSICRHRRRTLQHIDHPARHCRSEPSSPSLGVTLTTAAAILQGMSLPPDQPPPSPHEKPKLSTEERRARQADRLTTIRLRMAIGRELDERGITTPAAIGEAFGMPAAEATKLLNRHQWREGDVALLQAAVVRLGVQVPGTRGDND